MFIRDGIQALKGMGIAFVLSMTLTQVCRAADWVPDRQLRIISAYSAGGTNDLLSRLMAQKLSERLNQPVVVEQTALLLLNTWRSCPQMGTRW